MRRTTVVWSIAAIAATMLLVWAAGWNRRPAGPIDVGVILPLTGPVAGPGANARNGLQLAIDQFNAGSPPRRVRLIIEDSQSDPKAGMSSARKLIDIDGVKVIVGDIMSWVAMAVAPITERKGVVLFAPGASNPKFLSLGRNLFRNWASDDYDGTVMADYIANQLEFKMGGVLFVNNDYGLGLANAFQKRFKDQGGKVALSEGYDQGTTDFRPLVAKVRSMSNLEFLYLPGQPVENGYLVKQIREGGVSLPLFANLSAESPEFFSIVGAYGDGIIFTSPAFDPASESSGSASFRDAYTSKFGSPPDVTAGHGYDAGRILCQALTTCEFDLSKLRNALAATKNFDGVTGVTTFAPDREVHKDIMLKRLDQTGKATVVTKYAAG